VTVTKKTEKREHSSLLLTLTVGKEDVNACYDDVVTGYMKTLQVPGFRKGKVPRGVLINKYGDALKDETAGKLIEQAIEQVLDGDELPKEDRPLVYSMPEVGEKPVVNLDKDFTFSMTYDVMPQVTLGTWKGLTVEVPNVQVTDKDVAAELERVRERNAIVRDKEEGAAAAKGDYVTVDYCVLDERGEPLPDTAQDGMAFSLPAEGEDGSFRAKVAGMKVGDSKTIEEDAEAADANAAAQAAVSPDEAAAKKQTVRVTLKAIKVKDLPDLDDDLAQDVDEAFHTLDDLKKNIRVRIEAHVRDVTAERAQNAFIKAILETTPVDLPNSMVTAQSMEKWEHIAENFGIDGDSLLKMMSEQDGDEKMREMRDHLREKSTQDIREYLVRKALVAELQLDATDEEVNAEIERRLAMEDSYLKNARDYYENDEAREGVKNALIRDKLVAKLSELNTVTKAAKQSYSEAYASEEADHA
jgi:trigger factor